MDERIWAEALDDLREGAARRDAERELPRAAMRRVADSGFGALLVPTELGGDGSDVVELAARLQHLAAADPNAAQALRPHFGFVLRQLLATEGRRKVDDLRAIAAGAIYSTAAHEHSSATVGSLSTSLLREDGGLLLDGVKYYSTGTLYADRVSVVATTPEGGLAFATVPTDAEGVERVDDWNGFGQRLTASGTTRFDRVPVDETTLEPIDRTGPAALPAYYQLVLLATLAGIADAVVRDAVEYLRTRTRVYSHSTGATAAQDPFALATIGRLRAAQFAVSAAVRAAAESVDAAIRASAGDPSSERTLRLVEAAEEATSAAQVAIVPLVLDQTTLLFEVGGASATSRDRGLDRHWRNARTVASHNPLNDRARAVGDQHVNGTGLVYSFATGEAPRA